MKIGHNVERMNRKQRCFWLHSQKERRKKDKRKRCKNSSGLWKTKMCHDEMSGAEEFHEWKSLRVKFPASYHVS